jgi:spermidine/putrescine transport system permease protein
LKPTQRWFALPSVLLIAAGALAPIAVLAVLSFWKVENFALVPALSARAWAELAASASMTGLIAKAMLLGAAVAGITPFLAYPLALAMTRLPATAKGTAVIIALTPLYTGEIVRIYAWRLMLGAEGLVNTALAWLGLIQAPIKALLFTEISAVIVMVYNALPFMVIALWASAETIDRRLGEAARDLGARPATVFAKVTLPLTRLGMVGGMIVVFALSAGDALTPSLMGGAEGTTAMSMIETLFGTAFDWPLASAMALALLATLVVGAALIASPLIVAARRRAGG